jgi:hypothetical protein
LLAAFVLVARVVAISRSGLARGYPKKNTGALILDAAVSIGLAGFGGGVESLTRLAAKDAAKLARRPVSNTAGKWVTRGLFGGFGASFTYGGYFANRRRF